MNILNYKLGWQQLTTEERNLLLSNYNYKDTQKLMCFFTFFDVPYIEDVWNHLKQRNDKKPDATRIIMGKYLATMKLRGYINYSYKDTYKRVY